MMRADTGKNWRRLTLSGTQMYRPAALCTVVLVLQERAGLIPGIAVFKKVDAC